MHILFDHGTPRGLAPFLTEHRVTTALAMGWDRLSNGQLLSAAEERGFELLMTTDPGDSLPTESGVQNDLSHRPHRQHNVVARQIGKCIHSFGCKCM
jgi:hypothetical protein